MNFRIYKQDLKYFSIQYNKETNFLHKIIFYINSKKQYAKNRYFKKNRRELLKITKKYF